MKKLRKLTIFMLLLLGILGFLALITEAPAVSASASGGTFCDEGKTLYCWTQIPYWYCLDKGYYHCADPVNK